MPKGDIRPWVNLVMAFVLISEVSVRNYDTNKFNSKYILHDDFPAADSPVDKKVGKY